MVGPIVYIAMPLLAGVIVDHSSWRLVAVVWALGGLVILVASHALLPTTEPPAESRELLTPALAGVVLMASVQTVSTADRDGLLSVATLVRLGVAVVALAALYWAFRRTASPSLSLAALRQGGMLLLLVIVVLVSFANLWFYMTVGLQFLFGLDALQTAVVMLPAQSAGIAGAMIARSLMHRWGITAAGTVLLLALAVSLLLSALITADSPMWVPVVVMTLYAASSVGAGIPITNSVMDLAPPGEDGSASAFRSAAGNIGSAVGVVVMSAIVFTTFSTSLANTLEREGLDAKQSAGIAASIRAGVASEDVSANYAVPLRRVDQIAQAQQDAMGDGLRAHGLSGAAFTGVCLLIFSWARRRQAEAAAPDGEKTRHP
jgi:predicted MFS family arabinose efflux permease